MYLFTCVCLQGMQDTAHVQQHAFPCPAAQPKSKIQGLALCFDVDFFLFLQGMQDTAHVQQHAYPCPAAQPKPMVERPSSSIMSDAIEAVYGRQEVVEALPVEAFQCQLWEPAKSVLALEPGNLVAQCLCCAVPCRAVPCRAVPCRAVPCRAVLCCAVLCCAELGCAVPEACACLGTW